MWERKSETVRRKLRKQGRKQTRTKERKKELEWMNEWMNEWMKKEKSQNERTYRKNILTSLKLLILFMLRQILYMYMKVEIKSLFWLGKDWICKLKINAFIV